MPRIINMIRELNITYSIAQRYLSSRFGISVESVNSKIPDGVYERVIKMYVSDEAFQRELAKEYPIIKPIKLSPEEKLMAKYRSRNSKNRKGRSTVWTAIGKSTHIHFVNVPFGGKGRR